MTDDEMSELAEALEDACDAWIGSGGRVTEALKRSPPQCRCPFGVLLGGRSRFPASTEIHGALQIPVEDAYQFTMGFDGVLHDDGAEPPMYRLGQRFRQVYLFGGLTC